MKDLTNQAELVLTYRDVLSKRSPANASQKLITQESIKAHQFLINCPPESGIHMLSQMEVLQVFNKSLEKAGAGLQERKIWAVERLHNKGLLGEFNTDEGTKWFQILTTLSQL